MSDKKRKTGNFYLLTLNKLQKYYVRKSGKFEQKKDSEEIYELSAKSKFTYK